MKKIITYAFSLLSLTIIACEQILIEDDISNNTVQLIAPQNDEAFTATTVNFNWQAVPNAKKYKIQIAKPNFNTPSQIIVDAEVTNTSYNTQLNIGTYEWRIQAINGSYTTPFSTRKINVVSNQNFQDNTVTLTSPINNTASKNTTQNLTWQAVLGATAYQLQVYDTSNTIIGSQNTATTTTAFTFPEGNFTWRVRATNGSQQTLFSSNAITIDTTPPNTPSLIAPTNNTVTTTTTINFQWSRTTVSGSNEYDKLYIFKDSALTNLQTETQAVSPINVSLPTGTYYWYVKAFDASANESTRSNVNTLTIN